MLGVVLKHQRASQPCSASDKLGFPMVSQPLISSSSCSWLEPPGSMGSALAVQQSARTVSGREGFDIHLVSILSPSPSLSCFLLAVAAACSPRRSVVPVAGRCFPSARVTSPFQETSIFCVCSETESCPVFQSFFFSSSPTLFFVFVFLINEVSSVDEERLLHACFEF